MASERKITLCLLEAWQTIPCLTPSHLTNFILKYVIFLYSVLHSNRQTTVVQTAKYLCTSDIRTWQISTWISTVTSAECSTLLSVAACVGDRHILATVHSIYETVNSCHNHLDQISAGAFHLPSVQQYGTISMQLTIYLLITYLLLPFLVQINYSLHE